MEEKSIIFFLVLDTSENMKGTRIHALNNAMNEMTEALLLLSKYNAVENMKIAILEYNTRSNWITQNGPEDLEEFEWNWLEAGGVANMGDALQELDDKLKEYISYDENSFMPVFIFCISEYSADDYKEAMKNLQKNLWFKYGAKIGLCIGDDEKVVNMLADIMGNKESVVDGTHLELFRKLIRFIPMKDVLDKNV